MPRPPTKAHGIASAIAAKIVAGDYAAGAWLPSERELANEYGADRSTVRRALRLLADQNLVLIQPGTGTQIRVSEPVQRDASDITKQVGNWRGFAASVLQAGREPFTRTTVREIHADIVLAKWLAVPIGSQVLERARAQGIVGDPPVQTSTTYVNWQFAEKIPRLLQVDTGPGGIYSRLEEIGHRVEIYEESVTCRLPNKEEQHILEIRQDQPVLTLWRRAYDISGSIIEVTHRVVVGDRHDLIYRYGPGA
ncbi:GntR family transcriptional regulator [Sinosporangium album]|uniref:GntR family transcriptional regulator n=2 Tax=Sinosporangium album TaxID=504805 RepID=A0A1G8LH55_9ACTN|nr:GntR family transcriptional regulator [Sinosporangium album]